MRPIYVPSRPRVAERAVSVAANFTKGLVSRAGALAEEVAHVEDIRNMDPLPTGGVAKRNVVTPFSPQLPAEPVWLGSYEMADGTTWLLMSFADGALLGHKLGTTTLHEIKPAGGAPMRGTEANFKMILHDGVTQTRLWDGVGLTTLGQGFSPIGLPINPLNVGVPICKFSAVWQGRLWIGGTVENGVKHENRVRSSYPLFNLRGERDFDPNHYLDVDIGDNGERLTGFAVAGNYFFIFKEHHTYQVVGTDWDSGLFRFPAISAEFGAVSQEAITVLGSRAYFWDSRHGACLIEEEPNSFSRVLRARPIMQAIQPLLYEGYDEARAAETTVGAALDKVYFSIPWKGGGKRTLVLDVMLGAWTMYDLQLGAFTLITPRDGKSGCLAAHQGGTRVLILDQIGDADNFGSGPVDMTAWVRTAWLHAGAPNRRKWWKQATVVASGAGEFSVAGLLEWDGTVSVEAKALTPSFVTPSTACRPVGRASFASPGELRRHRHCMRTPGCSSYSISILVEAPKRGRWALDGVMIDAQIDPREC